MELRIWTPTITICHPLDTPTPLMPSILLRRGLVQATLHLVNREYAALADDFITLGLLPPGSDRAAIVPALTGVFQVLKSLSCARQCLNP